MSHVLLTFHHIAYWGIKVLNVLFLNTWNLSRNGGKSMSSVWSLFITKTRLYNFDPLKPHFYIVKLGFTGVYIIFLISAQNIDCGYSFEPPRRGGSNEYPQSMFWAEIWKISEFFYLKTFRFWWWNFQYIWIGAFLLCKELNVPHIQRWGVRITAALETLHECAGWSRSECSSPMRERSSLVAQLCYEEIEFHISTAH